MKCICNYVISYPSFLFWFQFRFMWVSNKKCFFPWKPTFLFFDWRCLLKALLYVAMPINLIFVCLPPRKVQSSRKYRNSWSSLWWIRNVTSLQKCGPEGLRSHLLCFSVFSLFLCQLEYCSLRHSYPHTRKHMVPCTGWVLKTLFWCRRVWYIALCKCKQAIRQWFKLGQRNVHLPWSQTPELTFVEKVYFWNL